MIGTFLPHSPKIIANSKNKINIFTQLNEPETKNGIWIQIEDQYENIVTDSEWFLGGEFDKTSDFVKNLSSALRAITINSSNGGSTGYYIKSFAKYMNDYYVLIGGGFSNDYYKNDLYKIIIDENNISLSKINTFYGTFQVVCQFGENNKYMIWSGILTGNGSSNPYTYVYNFETNEVKNIASVGWIADFLIYNNNLYYLTESSSGNEVYFNKAEGLDFSNPTTFTGKFIKLSSVSYGNISYNFKNIISYQNKIYFMNSSGNLVELIIDENDNISLGETLIALTELGVTRSGNDGNGDFDRRGYSFCTSNGLFFYIGGYYTGAKYFILNLNSKTLVSKGTITEIIHCISGRNSIVSGNDGYIRIIEELDGTLVGCLSVDGVLRYNVQSKQYDEKTIILSKLDPVTGTYYTEFVSYEDIEDLNQGTHLFKTGFEDILYFHDGSLDNTLPTYYGDGTQWIKFKN